MKSHKGQLVCQHLENISRRALEQYQGLVREYVKGRHGVYALYRKGRLQYVGLASNLRNRLKSHLKDRHALTWDTFSVYLTIKDSHLYDLETLVLKIATPKGNRLTGNFIKSDDLKPRFKRDISRYQHDDLIDLLGLTSTERIPALVAQKAEGRAPVLAKYPKRPMFLRARYKGKMIKARVLRDGSISLDGKTYLSPSLAGAAACKRRTCNGWTFWTYERAPGDWVLLNELRKR
ncbi:MAG: restriction system modified-DNA reader domain-containing protein [Nitrospirota bacterium]